jgi:hypothetical protein
VTRVLVLAAAYLAVQAAALLLTETGDWGLGWTAPWRAPLRSVIAVAIVMAGAVALLAATGFTTLMRRLPVEGWRVAAGVGVLTLCGVLVRPSLADNAAILALTVIFVSLGLALLAAIASNLPSAAADDLMRRLVGWQRALPWLASAWTLSISVLLAWVAFERVPHVPDEVAYWFQAKYFSAGRVFLPAPPEISAFELPHTLVSGDKWYGIFPPGWPAVLAIGMRLGVPWLVNPVLGAVAVVLLHRLTSDLYSRRIADVAVLLLSTSPMFLLMSAGLMSHPLSLVLALVTVLGWRRGVGASAPRWAVAGGLALGGLVLTRPFEGAILTVVLTAWSLVRLVSGSTASTASTGIRRLTGFVAVAIVTGAAMLPYNAALTGRRFYDPITKYFDERYYPGSNRLGFGSDVGNTGWRNDLLPGHSPIEAVLNGHRNLYLLNLELFGWACGSLAAVTLLIFFGRWSSADAFVTSLAAAIVGGLALYWYSGADFGARYWYQLLVPLAMLSARGLESLADRARGALPERVVAGRLAAAVGVAALSAVVILLPWRAATKYHHYRGMGNAIAGLAAAKSFEHALVFVRGAGQGTPFSRYSAASVFNPPLLDGAGPVFVRDVDGESRQRIECAFAGRVVRVIDTTAMPAGPVLIDEGPGEIACGTRPSTRTVAR